MEPGPTGLDMYRQMFPTTCAPLSRGTYQHGEVDLDSRHFSLPSVAAQIKAQHYLKQQRRTEDTYLSAIDHTVAARKDKLVG